MDTKEFEEHMDILSIELDEIVDILTVMWNANPMDDLAEDALTKVRDLRERVEYMYEG